MPKIAEIPAPERIDVNSLRESLSRGEIDLICVLGPTASGKTRYAVALARALGNAEIISADSRQVYKGMDIGTGKDMAEYGEVPVHLIDILPAGAQYNVFQYQKDFAQAYAGIVSRGHVPILCGGTGLYISSVTGRYDWSGSKPLSEPAAGEVTSSSLDLPSKTYFIGISVSREERVRRIDKRLDERLSEGMIEEVKGLIDSGVSTGVLLSYGLEYKFVTRYLLGEISYEQMRSELAIAIHQFSKRQMTWWRGMERSGIVIHWTDAAWI